jgi:hypothetical protein
VVDEKLAGQVLQRKSGRLASAVNFKVNDGGRIVETVVGFNRNTAPEGVFHEFGVNKSWLIEAKNADFLKFEWHGVTHFRRKVIHPPLPERSFLRSALTQIVPEVKPTIENELSGMLA